MTTSEIDTAPRPIVHTADEISQGTAIEQARAVAEAQAAVMVAQRCPRSVPEAVRQMRESCEQTGLAERAFFRYNRAGTAITGPSIHLARELARCWGNMRYGIVELRRDDIRGESEMHAFAEDLQTNTRATTTFIVKHLRDTKNGVKPLVDQRDIYESNANNGARRLREQIFAILPKWFSETAQDVCQKTLRDGGGKPLAQRIADAVKVYESLGVTADQLEQKQGRASDKWTEHDVAALGVMYKSIQRGEITLEEEFPPQRVTLDEVEQAAPKRNGRAAAKATPPADPAPGMDDADAAAQAEFEAEQQRGPGGLFGDGSS